MAQAVNVWSALDAFRTPAPAPPAAKAPRAPARPKTLKAGDRRGEWTLLEYIPGHGRKGAPDRVPGRWRCRCSCGAVRLVQASNITNGVSGSCGHGRRSS